MNINDLKTIAPAVFTTAPSPKMSGLYTFVNTQDILESFDREGWTISSARQRGKTNYSVHEIRLRNGSFPKVGDTLVEAIIRNSHNGMSSFNVSAGLHRLVCSNGLTVPTAISQSIALRHQNFDLGEVRRMTDQFASQIPTISGSVEKMMSKHLDEKDMYVFAKAAMSIRWKEGSIPVNITPEKLLIPNRVADNKNDMWSVFNVVQEKFVRGGFGYRSNNGRQVKARALNDILTTNRINTKLWELADSMC